MNGILVGLALKHPYLTQFRRAMWPAHLLAGSTASTVWFEASVHVPAQRHQLRSDLVTSLTTSPPLARALAERNYDRLTPVQTAVLADAASVRDLLVSAQTGSGQTVAYRLATAKTL